MHALGIVVEQRHGPVRVLAGQAAQAEADHVGHRFVGRHEARRLVEQLGLLRHIDQQAALRAEGGEPLHQAAGQAVVARLGRQLGAVPALGLGELAFGSPHAEQGVAGGRLRLAHVPQLVGVGIAFGALAVAQFVLAIEAVQLGEVELGVVVLDEGVPLAAFGQPAQPAQFHPVGLGQVAMLGKKLLDLGVAGALEARRQFVVGQVGLQRIITQGLFVTAVRAAVALGQGTLGFIVVLALLGEIGGLDGAGRGGGKKQTGYEAEQAAAHDTSGQFDQNECRRRQHWWDYVLKLSRLPGAEESIVLVSACNAGLRSARRSRLM